MKKLILINVITIVVLAVIGIIGFHFITMRQAM